MIFLVRLVVFIFVELVVIVVIFEVCGLIFMWILIDFGVVFDLIVLFIVLFFNDWIFFLFGEGMICFIIFWIIVSVILIEEIILVFLGMEYFIFILLLK